MEQVARLRPWLQACGGVLCRLAWQKSNLHVRLYLDLSGWATISARKPLDDLRIAVSMSHMNK
jgi:hypothetical protein